MLAAGHARRAATAPTGALDEVPEQKQRAYNTVVEELEAKQRARRDFERNDKAMRGWVTMTLKSVLPLFKRHPHVDAMKWQETYQSLENKYETLSPMQAEALGDDRTRLMQELVGHLLQLADAWDKAVLRSIFPRSYSPAVALVVTRWDQLTERVNALANNRAAGMQFMREELQARLYPIINALPKER